MSFKCHSMDSNVNYVIEKRSRLSLSIGGNRENLLSKNASLAASEPQKLLNLINSLLNYKTADIEKKINVYIENETGAKAVFIGSLQENSIVIRVIGQSTLNSKHYLSTQNFIYQEILKTKCSLTENITHFDTDFQKLLEEYFLKKIDYYEIILVPIKLKVKANSDSTIHTVVHVVNTVASSNFVINVVNETFRYCLPILLKTIKLEDKSRIKKQCQLLLYTVKKLFCYIGNSSTDILNKIVMETRRLMNAEKCCLFLLDVDGEHMILMASDGIDDDLTVESRIVYNEGIEGRVLTTGEIVNIRNDIKSLLHCKMKGNWIKTILCFPIRDEYGIIGIIRVYNKTIGDFNSFDEEIAAAFSVYCGLCIKLSLVHTKLIKETAQNKLSNSIMTEHLQVNETDVENVFFCANRHSFIDYDCFNFVAKKISVAETPCQLIKILEDLDMLDKFDIKRNKFIKFILHLMKGYNNAPYHNWMLAFSIAHCGYVFIKQLSLISKGYFTHLEALAYIMACICHGVDRKISIDSHHLKLQNSIENLFTASNYAIEHSISQSLRILNAEECNFLDGLSSDNYQLFLKDFKNMMLACNLSNSIKVMGTQKKMIEEGFDISVETHKNAFINLIITSAQFSDQLKDWKEVKVSAQSMFDELCLKCSCKDLLERSLQAKEIAMVAIPDMQIQFLFSICLPIFLSLSELFPVTIDLLESIHKNIIRWESCKSSLHKKFATDGEAEATLVKHTNTNCKSLLTRLNNWFKTGPATLKKSDIFYIFLVYLVIFIIIPYYYTL